MDGFLLGRSRPVTQTDGQDIFLSYSTLDRIDAVRLQRELERFRLPRSLVSTPGRYGPVPKRLGRVFMDRTDLSAAPNINAEIEAELARSANLVVLCSNSAADPAHWVDREIAAYRRVNPTGRIFAVIVRDEPPGCFPPELLRDAAGLPAIPLAADQRPQGDGRRDALLKLVAGIAGISFDVLRRQRARALRRRRAVLTGIGVVYAATISSALVGVSKASIELLASRNVAIADRAKAANDAGRSDLAMLLAATALPISSSWAERANPAAEAQAVRALLGQRVEEMYPSGGAILSAWSSARSRLYLALSGGEASAVDVGSEMRRSDWRPGVPGVTQLAVSDDGRLVAMAVAGGVVIVVDAASGAIMHRSPSSPSPGRALAFSQDGERLAVGRQDGTAQVWKVGAPSWGASAPLQASWPVSGIAFSADGSHVLSALNPTLLEWDANTGQPVRQLPGHGTVMDIATLGDRSWGVSYNLAKLVSVLTDASTPERVVVLPHSAARVRASGDGTFLAAASWEGSQAIIASAGTGEIRATLQHSEWVDDAMFLPDSGNVLTLSRDGFLRSWRNPSLPAGQRYQVLPQGGPTVIASGSGTLFYVGGGSPGLAEVDTGSGAIRPIATLPCKDPNQAANHCWVVGLQVLQPGGDLLYAVGDGRVGRINPATGETRWQKQLDGAVNGLATRAGMAQALLAVGTRKLVAVDIETGDLAAVDPPGPSDAEVLFRTIAFDPAGDRIAATDDRGISIRRASDSGETWRAPVYDRIAVSAAWLPNDGLLAVGSAGNTVQLFPAQGGRPAHILRGHTSWVTSLSARPGGRYLASLSNNEAIVWDVLAGEAVLHIAHDGFGGFSNVTFAADGQHLALSDSTGALRWVPFPVPQGDLRPVLCRAIPKLGRQFSNAQMQELGFLWASDRRPCERPPLLSLDQLRSFLPARH